MSPDQFASAFKQASALHTAGRLDEAARAYERLLASASGDFALNHLLGTLRHQQGRFAEALPLLDRALRARPVSPPTLMCKGLTLHALGESEKAEQFLREASRLAPLDAKCRTNLGIVLLARGNIKEAVAAFQESVRIKPDYAFGWSCLGNAFQLASHTTEALACFNRVIEIDPDFDHAFCNRASVLRESHRLEEALADFDTQLRRTPQSLKARSARLLALNYRSNLSREELFREHRDYNTHAITQLTAPALPRLGPGHPRASATPLRLAILSPDFREHSVAYFIEPLLANIDPARFELFLYHNHMQEDAVTERIRPLAKVWRNVVSRTDASLYDTIRADAPDIILDLTGHTGFNRLPLFARRLAPLQITYLGYPNTTGLDAMDYRLTDAIVDPCGDADPFYSEKLVRFSSCAWTYLPPTSAPNVTLPPSLGDGVIRFGSFNSASKISRETLFLWQRVLAAVPNSQLILKSLRADEAFWPRLLTQAGIPLERVTLLPAPRDTAAHLAAYGEVDIALDTYPYNGTTTTCEALWMGVPVVTIAGDRHASRVGASLLTAIGQPDWVASTPDQYVAIATRLANSDLATLRTAQRDRLRRSILLDHPAQARCLMNALDALWRENSEAS